MDERSIFERALDFDDDASRDAFLCGACLNDESLRQRVDSLLSAHAKECPVLDEQVLPSIDTAELPQEIELPDKSIGPYTIREQIGEGGMGIVYVAEQFEPVARKVALKIIKPGMDTKQVIARFESERQALAMMDHPNIAKVLDAGGTESGRPYFVMDLVRGLSLTAYCDKQRLNTRQRLALFVTVCHAVQHAHQKGIIHRDIKPGNVLVTCNGERAVPKVIDFGVAKATNQRLTERTVYTKLNQMIGTPLYMSPEQAALSDPNVDTRTDIYSLGVVLYELLTGSTPFAKERLSSADFDEIRRIIREDEPPRPSDRVSTLAAKSLSTICDQHSCEVGKIRQLLRGELDWIVMKAIEKDRTRRYESASALAADVQRYLDNEPVAACPPSVTYRFQKFARRNKVAIATAGIVVLALLLGIAGTSWQAWRATRERDEKVAALAAANTNLQTANVERERAEANLQLAMQTVEEAYLESIGEDRLLRVAPEIFMRDWDEQYGRSVKFSRMSQKPVFSQQEQELIQRGLAFYDQIARQNPSSRQALLESARAFSRLALLHAGLDENDEAQKSYEEAISRLSRLTSQDPTRPEYFLELARAYYQQGRLSNWWPQASDTFEEAVIASSRAIELAPNKAWYWSNRGLAHDQLGRWGEALDDFSQAIQLEPDEAMYWHNRGNAHGQLVQWEKAVVDFSQAIQLAPDEPMYWHKRGSAHGQLVQWEKAVEDFSQAIQLAPNKAVFWHNRGIAHLELGQWDEAIEDHSHGIQLAPDEPMNWNDRGFAHAQLGQWDKAIEDYSQAIQLEPDKAMHWANRGVTHRRLDQWEKALADFSQASQLRPDDLTLWNSRSLAHSKLGQWEEAVATIEEALRLFPDGAVGFYNNLSCLYREIPQTDERNAGKAVDMARKAIGLDPSHSSSWGNLGSSLYEVGKYQEALSALEESIKLDGDKDIGDKAVSKRCFLIAKIHWQLGAREKARASYDEAITRMNKLPYVSAAHQRDRAKAEDVMGISNERVAEQDSAATAQPQHDMNAER